MQNSISGFILAAGLGTRLKPWTDHHPKALAIVNGKSLLQRNIEYLQSFGILDIVVNVHHFADQIVDSIQQNNGWGSKVMISDETDKVLETGGGLLKARPLLEKFEKTVLMNCDILTDLNLTDMIHFHSQQNAVSTLAVTQRETSRYLLFNEDSEMVGWQNVKTSETKLPRPCSSPVALAFSGIHMLSNRIFDQIKLTEKFSTIDLYLDICAHQKIVGFEHTGSRVLDVGKPEAIFEAEKLFA
ncbi:MAG: nucleotidyltransferase family protein [Leadbetterella sp.]